MDYNNKLKLAKEALDSGSYDRETIEYIFPELAESEDERIRKALKEYFINSFQNNGVAAICGMHIKDILAWLEKQSEQILANSAKTCKNGQKPAWSEEDEKVIDDAESWLDMLCGYLKNNSSQYIPVVKEVISKLKSLKDRYTWKPSEGQLECLGYAIEKAEKDWSPLTNNRIYLTLKALKEQLLELRGSKV